MAEMHILEIAFNSGGVRRVVHPVAVADGDRLVLIDAGYPDQEEALEQQLRSKGIDPKTLSAIIVTHHDYDHIGSLAALKARHPRASILSSEEQSPYLEGRKPPMRLPMYRDMLEMGTDAEQALARDMIGKLAGMVPTPVDQIVRPGERIGCCGGIRIIGTPGHMPGHISVYLEAFRALIAGDALNVINGRLHGANPAFTFDPDRAELSILSLEGMAIDRIVCYHGGEPEGNAAEALDEVIQRLKM